MFLKCFPVPYPQSASVQTPKEHSRARDKSTGHVRQEARLKFLLIDRPSTSRFTSFNLGEPEMCPAIQSLTTSMTDPWAQNVELGIENAFSTVREQRCWSIADVNTLLQEVFEGETERWEKKIVELRHVGSSSKDGQLCSGDGDKESFR